MKVLFCVLLYNYSYDKSPTIMSLIKGGVNEKNIFYKDNSQVNEKLSYFYNSAYKYAKNNGFEYIVLLDDDTELSDDYLFSIVNTYGSVVVPSLIKNNKIISPIKYKHFNRFCMSGIRIYIQDNILFPIPLCYSLYGIDDYVMIKCIKSNREIINIADVSIEHDLSTVDGLSGCNKYNSFKILELMRGYSLNIRLAPFSSKMFFLKKIFYFIYLSILKRCFFKSLSVLFFPYSNSNSNYIE